MAFLDHIRFCNAWTPEGFRPFLIGGQQIGWVREDMAARLRTAPDVFYITARSVSLSPRLTDPEERTEAVSAVMRSLHANGEGPRLRGELFPVRARWSSPDLMRMDRGVTSVFGIRAFGVHLNGVVRLPDPAPGSCGLALWIGTRALDKAVAPGKLDNLVAGGQPAHLTLADNLVKEGEEEAGLPAALTRTARSTSVITYSMADRWGVKNDTLYVFDLDMPAGFTPVNTDGEVTGFTLMPVEQVLDTVRDSDAFKFNVALVLIDFGIRHGLITADAEPDFDRLATGLRAAHHGLG